MSPGWRNKEGAEGWGGGYSMVAFLAEVIDWVCWQSMHASLSETENAMIRYDIASPFVPTLRLCLWQQTHYHTTPSTWVPLIIRYSSIAGREKGRDIRSRVGRQKEAFAIGRKWNNRHIDTYIYIYSSRKSTKTINNINT